MLDNTAYLLGFYDEDIEHLLLEVDIVCQHYIGATVCKETQESLKSHILDVLKASPLYPHNFNEVHVKIDENGFHISFTERLDI